LPKTSLQWTTSSFESSKKLAVKINLKDAVTSNSEVVNKLGAVY